MTKVPCWKNNFPEKATQPSMLIEVGLLLCCLRARKILIHIINYIQNYHINGNPTTPTIRQRTRLG
jgi:hypothetical protein